MALGDRVFTAIAAASLRRGIHPRTESEPAEHSTAVQPHPRTVGYTLRDLLRDNGAAGGGAPDYPTFHPARRWRHQRGR